MARAVLEVSRHTFRVKCVRFRFGIRDLSRRVSGRGDACGGARARDEGRVPLEPAARESSLLTTYWSESTFIIEIIRWTDLAPWELEPDTAG